MNVLSFVFAHAKDISILMAAISGSISAIVGVMTFKLKIKAENNLKLKNEAEIDINLIKQFSELITIANGRSGYLLSEKAVESFFNAHSSLSDKIPDEFGSLNNKIKELALLTIPVGRASQNATAVSLTDLAVKNSILLDAAIVGIQELPIDEKIKQQCLNKLRS